MINSLEAAAGNERHLTEFETALVGFVKSGVWKLHFPLDAEKFA